MSGIPAGLPPPPPTLSLEQVRSALQEVTALLERPDVLAQLDAVKAAAGADAMMALMLVRSRESKSSGWRAAAVRERRMRSRRSAAPPPSH